MSDNTLTDMDELQRKKTAYEKINFWSCFVGFLMAIVGCVVNVVTQFDLINIYVCLAVVIVACVIALVAVIFMIISCVKLRKINRLTSETDPKNSENK